jgi:hypothetical protein
MEEVERKTVKRKLRQLRRSALKGQGGEGEGSSTMMLAQKERRGKSWKSKRARKQPFFKLSFSACNGVSLLLPFLHYRTLSFSGSGYRKSRYLYETNRRTAAGWLAWLG